jgi:hypothetical protein
MPDISDGDNKSVGNVHLMDLQIEHNPSSPWSEACLPGSDADEPHPLDDIG